MTNWLSRYWIQQIQLQIGSFSGRQASQNTLHKTIKFPVRLQEELGWTNGRFVRGAEVIVNDTS